MLEGSAKSVSVVFETTGPAFATRLASLATALLPLLPLFPPPAPSFVFNIVTSAQVTSAGLFPPPASVSTSDAGMVFLSTQVRDGDAAGATAMLSADSGAGGRVARTLVPHLDLNALLAGGELHLAPGHVRLPVRAAHHALVLAPLAGAEAFARARSGFLPVARPLVGHPDPDGRVAGSDSQVAAGLVRHAVRAAHRSLAPPADVGARAGAQRQALHVLHAHLELGALYLCAGATCNRSKRQWISTYFYCWG